jgi:hypothetical protein
MPRLRTLRLVFAYEGDDVRLLSVERVEMRPLPSDELEPVEKTAGFWYELRDGAERTLYRRIAQHPTRTSTEVLTDDPERPLRRVDVSDPRGEFVLLAPDLDEAQTLVFVGSPGGDAATESRELARFPLK